MSAPASVLGVLPVCRLVSLKPTQLQPPVGVDSRSAVLGVLGLASRACACASFCVRFSVIPGGRKKRYARAGKPNKPDTLNTEREKSLIFRSFSCVGCVLGWLFLCWVGDWGVPA